MNTTLEGSCSVAIAAYATTMGEELLLKGLVGNVESGSILRAESSGSISQPGALGELVAKKLLAIGAGKLLEGV